MDTNQIRFVGLMSAVFAVVAWYIGHTFGAFAFAQILGSFQNVQARGIKLTVVTILIWSVLLFAAVFASCYLPQNVALPFAAGMIVALFRIFRAGKME